MLFLCSIERGRSSVPTAFGQAVARSGRQGRPLAAAPSARRGLDRSEHGGTTPEAGRRFHRSRSEL
jgi:hypothetical protein